MVAKKKVDNNIQTVGRRKTSIARCNMKKGTGIIRINGLDLEEVVNNSVMQLRVLEPLILSDMQSKIDLNISLNGGGVNSQVDALRQAIARGIVEMLGEDTKKKFAKYDRTLIV